MNRRHVTPAQGPAKSFCPGAPSTQSMETLEDRTFLSANLPGLHPVDPHAGQLTGQVIYLDFDGATDVTYRGPRTIQNIDVPAFDAGTGDRQAIINSTVQAVKQAFDGTGVVFTTVRPAKGPFSTVYIGGTNTAFAKYGSFAALSEKVDVGNLDHGDNAFVFSDRLLRVKKTVDGFAKSLPKLIVHEVGHLLGYAHNTPGKGPWADVAQITRSPGIAVISVPHYKWWYGCQPTAVGVIMGYWDGHGVDVIPGDASQFTQNVKDAIASTAHIVSGQENKPIAPNRPPQWAKYWGNGDWHNSPSYPNHEANPDCLADYMRTVDGITYIEGIFWGTRRWLDSRGSTGWHMWQDNWVDGAVTWDKLTTMVDMGFPLLASVDSDADGIRDHSAVVVGYNANTNQYCVYDTVTMTNEWFNFGPIHAGTKYGIDAFQYFAPPDATVTASVVKNTATESKTDYGTLRISRQGANAFALDVSVKVVGNAINGKDYKMIPATITIPAGKNSVLVKVVANKDMIKEKVESVLVQVADGDMYKVGTAWQAKVVIAANAT